MPLSINFRSARIRRGWLFLLGGIALLVLAVPAILSTSTVLNAVLPSALPPGVGTLSAQGGSFGWTGSTALTGVEFRAPNGATVFTAQRIEVASSLLQLASGSDAPIAVRIDKPIVNIELRGSHPSNIESLLEAIALENQRKQTTEPKGPAQPKRPMTLQLVDAEARVLDATTGERWLVDHLSVSYTEATIPHVEATGRMVEVAASGMPPAVPGDFSLRVGAADAGGQLVRAKIDSVPLSVVGALLRRNDPTARFTGWVSLEGDAAWQPPTSGKPVSSNPVMALLAQGLTTSGRITLVNPVYSGVLTGGEPLRVAGAEAPWRLAAKPDRLQIETLAAHSEIGSARVAGHVTPPELAAWLAGQFALPSGLRGGAEVDLARLAAIAPEVLRLQKGVRIESGTVRADVTSRIENGVPRLMGEIRTDSLTGTSGRKRIEWQRPLRVTFSALRPGEDWQVENLRCESDFLTANASGNESQIKGTANFDLDRLGQHLRQFVDLGDWRLAGQGEARATWQRQPGQQPGAWRLATDGLLTDLLVGSRERPLAEEPRLEFDVQLTGVQGDATFARTADVSLKAQGDELQLRLAAPGENASERPLRMDIIGNLATWHRRAQLVVPSLPSTAELRIAGRIEARAEGVLSKQGGRLSKCHAMVKNLAVDSRASGLVVREQQVELTADAEWNNATGSVRSEVGQLVASSFSCRTRKVRFSVNDPTGSQGEMAFRADLARIGRWFPPASAGPRYEAEGVLEGTMALSGVSDGLSITANATGQQIALYQIARGTGPMPSQAGSQRTLVWSEPHLQTNLRALARSIPINGTTSQLAVKLQEMKITSQTLAATAKGQVRDLARLQGVQLDGTIDYDLEKLSPLLWPHLGQSVQLFGRERATFHFSGDGPMATHTTGLAALQGQMEAPWQGANLFGLQVGPGRLRAALAEGVLRTDPLDVTVGQGRLTTQAAVTLVPLPRKLELAPGPLVTDVAISQEVSEKSLKYIAPVLADATRVEGRFSVSLSELSAPLGNPQQARVTGLLTIHNAQVAPGPSTAEWVALIRQVRDLVRDGVAGAVSPSASLRPILTITDRAVPFQMVEGRVYHRGLEFDVGDAVVSSEGSVGIDETIDLLLTVPIQDEWLRKNASLLGGLRGQTVRFPIRGTLSQPKVDRDALRQLSQQLVQSAAQGAISTGLDKLFRKLGK